MHRELAFSLLPYQQHVTHRDTVFFHYLLLMSPFFCIYLSVNPTTPLCNSEDLTHHRLRDQMLWCVLLIGPTCVSSCVFVCPCVPSVRRGDKIAPTAIKDDNSTVHSGNFGRIYWIRSTIPERINTEERDADVTDQDS